MAGPYVDPRPQFQFSHCPDDTVNAEVYLPLSVDPKLRHAVSLRSWKTERHAKKDAAFQAYVKLYHSGLINEHLLPVRSLNESNDMPQVEDRPALQAIETRIDPWKNLAAMASSSTCEWTADVVEVMSAVPYLCTSIIMLYPGPSFAIPSYPLYWNQSISCTVSSRFKAKISLNEDQLAKLRETTHLLLNAGYDGSFATLSQDYTVLFSPIWPIETGTLQSWLSSKAGTNLAMAVSEDCLTGKSFPQNYGLLRNRGKLGGTYIIENVLPNAIIPLENCSTTAFARTDYLIRGTKFPKRRDFLHQLDSQQNHNEAFTSVYELLASECTVDRLPVSFAVFGRFIPCILHRFELYQLAHMLRDYLKASLSNTGLPSILTAITAPSASEHVNYERVEFIGDCVLKFCTSVSLMATKPNWPESFLTSQKSRINSNSFLQKAFLKAGLHQFLVRQIFTGAKWRPKYVQASLFGDQEPRSVVTVSTKTMADVVEALIGASYVDGGISEAVKCIKVLLDNEGTAGYWIELDMAHQILYAAVPSSSDGFPKNSFLPTSLIHYSFVNETLALEALTHASYIHGGIHAASYQRLEFLGDAVLDYIISTRLFTYQPILSHQEMHTIRTASVNSGILAFLGFELSEKEERINVCYVSDRDAVMKHAKTVYKSLWQLMRHSSDEIAEAQVRALERHNRFRDEILEALNHQKLYPWSILARCAAEKFFSDVIESTIGAIYIDSRGSISACSKFLEQLGLLRVVDRLVHDKVDCLHPKERLGQLAVSEEVKYVKVEDDKTGSLNYKCQVIIGGEKIGNVVEGKTRSQAEIEAAWQACLSFGQTDTEHVT
jgi:dsRNA-specific ribonuclease